MVKIPFSQIEEFYQSPLGHFVSRALAQKISFYWPNQKQGLFLGVGYPFPYILHFQEQPGHWSIFVENPKNSRSWKKMSLIKGIPVFYQESLYSFSDNQFDRLFLIHSIEFTEEPLKFFREMWRILKPEGEMMIVFPHDYSLWSRQKGTPWASPHPYSLSQVLNFLEKTFFQLLQKEKGLFTPPFKSSRHLFFSPFFEKAGSWGLWPFSGVWMIRVKKQLYSPIFQGEKGQSPIILLEIGSGTIPELKKA
jgi:SAM-dependent methyltransferase